MITVCLPWKSEDIVLGECLQIGANSFFDVHSLLAQLIVLERPHEVPCQFFHGQAVRPARQHASLFDAVDQELSVLGELQVSNDRSDSKGVWEGAWLDRETADEQSRMQETTACSTGKESALEQKKSLLGLSETL